MGKDETNLEDIREIVVLGNEGAMSSAEAKIKLGEIACALIYDEGYDPHDARDVMIEFEALRPLFQKAGYVRDGVIGYNPQTLERWARRYNEQRLTGDKRRISTQLFAHQLAQHLQMQQRLHRQVMKGDLFHATRYVQVSELIGKMVPGLFVSDPSSVKVTNITVTAEQRQALVDVQKAAEQKVREFEAKIIEGEIVE